MSIISVKRRHRIGACLSVQPQWYLSITWYERRCQVVFHYCSLPYKLISYMHGLETHPPCSEVWQHKQSIIHACALIVPLGRSYFGVGVFYNPYCIVALRIPIPLPTAKASQPKQDCMNTESPPRLLLCLLSTRRKNRYEHFQNHYNVFKSTVQTLKPWFSMQMTLLGSSLVIVNSLWKLKLPQATVRALLAPP